MATWYVDYEGGNNANTGASYAQRVKTIAGLAGKGVAAGDTVRLMASLDPTSLGNGTWTSNSSASNNSIVTLAAAATKTIDNCESAWTAGTGVTVTTGTASGVKQGSFYNSLVIGGSYVAGTNMGYKDLGSTQDFSAYQQLCLWIRVSATAAASDYSIVFYSDASATVAVNTINLPALGVANTWIPVVVDNGSALSATVRTVGLVRNAGSGTPTVLIDNLFTSKAPSATDCLTLYSLIGKNDGTGWHTIRSVSGTTVTLDWYYNNTGYTDWYGVSETVTTYVRQPINLGINTTQSTALAGTISGYIYWEGGWNRTDMSTQTGETHYMNPVSNGTTFTQQTDFTSWNKLGFWGGSVAWLIASNNNCKYSNCYAGASSAVNWSGQNFATLGNSWDTCFSWGSDGGWSIYGDGNKWKSCRAVGSYTYPFGAYGANGLIEGCTIGATATHCVRTVGLQYGAQGLNNLFRNCVFANAATADVLTDTGPNYFDNCLFGSTTEFGSNQNQGSESYHYSTNHDQTADNHVIVGYGFRVASDTSVRHTASGISWKMSVTSANKYVDYPAKFVIARPYVRAGSLVTVKAWFRRTNTGLTASLVARANQLGGPSTLQSTSMSVAADTWEELTISWTPTTAGVVEIEAQAYGGSTYSVYIDDMTITQA